jgi:uncharacterized membrane protein
LKSPLPRPDHIAEIIRVTAKLHADHHSTDTSLHRGVERVVDLLVLVGVVWKLGNSHAPTIGYAPVDAPFQWLELVASLSALCIAILILTTHRRDDRLAQQREQMTLELAVLSEQKLAKIMDLVEESRRDNRCWSIASTHLPKPWCDQLIRMRFRLPSRTAARERRIQGRLPAFLAQTGTQDGVLGN